MRRKFTAAVPENRFKRKRLQKAQELDAKIRLTNENSGAFSMNISIRAWKRFQ